MGRCRTATLESTSVLSTCGSQIPEASPEMLLGRTRSATEGAPALPGVASLPLASRLTLRTHAPTDQRVVAGKGASSANVTCNEDLARSARG